MRAVDGASFTNLSANSGTFRLLGGNYGACVIAGSWSSGSVTLEMLAGDDSTYVTCMTAFSANGYETAYLPAGTYKFVVATATGVYAVITRIPGE